MFTDSIIVFSVSSSKPTTAVSETLALTHACTHMPRCHAAVLQVWAEGNVYLHPHTPNCQLIPTPSAVTFQGWFPPDKFNADTDPFPRWRALSEPTWPLFQLPRVVPRRKTSQPPRDLPDVLGQPWSTGGAGWIYRGIIYICFICGLNCAHSAGFFTANVLSMYFCWSGSIYSGNTRAERDDRWHLDPDFHSALRWIHASWRVQYCTEVSSTAGGAHYMDNIRCQPCRLARIAADLVLRLIASCWHTDVSGSAVFSQGGMQISSLWFRYIT